MLIRFPFAPLLLPASIGGFPGDSTALGGAQARRSRWPTLPATPPTEGHGVGVLSLWALWWSLRLSQSPDGIVGGLVLVLGGLA